MVIICDTREKFIDRIKSIIISLDDAPEVKISCLNKGDYDLINGGKQLRVERKSINDFCGSYKILKKRLHEMRLQNEYTALLLEGTYSVQGNMIWVHEGNHLQPRMDYTTFSNFLLHQSSMGTWITQTMNFEESIKRLIVWHDYLPKLNAPSSIKCGSSTELLAQLPGIGAQTLKELKEKYATPMDALLNLPKKANESLMKW